MIILRHRFLALKFVAGSSHSIWLALCLNVWPVIVKRFLDYTSESSCLKDTADKLKH